MSNPICQDCIYFLRHYTLSAQRCTPVSCGHCRYPRLKHRRPDDPACSYFIRQELPLDLPKQEEVINFLTTDFLQYIMTLPLPPEISDNDCESEKRY